MAHPSQAVVRISRHANGLEGAFDIFHLKGNANQWWQWLPQTLREDDDEVTWKLFVGESWARFGPTKYEDFDEALSKVQQFGFHKGLPKSVFSV